MSADWLLALAVSALLVFWAVGAYNRMVRLKYAIGVSFTQLDLHLRRHLDLSATMANLCREQLRLQGLDPDALQSLEASRNQAVVAANALRGRPGSARAAAAFSLASLVLDASLAAWQARLDATAPGVVEARAGLAANVSNMHFAQRSFNAAVQAYNDAVGQFPAVLLARLFALAPARSAAIARTRNQAGDTMKVPLAIAGAVFLFAAMLPTRAQIPAARVDSARDALYIKSLAATCANCHGTDGRAVAGSSVPNLAGRPGADLLAQLQAFKSGARPATVMHQISKGYSDRQLEQIATYLAAQKP